jgi:hypothetical protein
VQLKVTTFHIKKENVMEIIRAIIYEHVNFGGRTFDVIGDTPVIPPPMGSGDGQASSLRIFGPEWVVFWETVNYDEGDDQLWIAPPPSGRMWELSNLHILPRPHGNNIWGDRIRAVSLSNSGPTGDNDNRLILNPDGTWTCGFSVKELKFKNRVEMPKLSINPVAVH